MTHDMSLFYITYILLNKRVLEKTVKQEAYGIPNFTEITFYYILHSLWPLEKKCFGKVGLCIMDPCSAAKSACLIILLTNRLNLNSAIQWKLHS